MKLTHFKDINFLPAIKVLFKGLNVPMNYVADEPTTAKEILKDCKKNDAFFQQMDDVYFVGMVDDAAFEGNESLAPEKIKSDYDGILIFGVTLKQRPNNLLPTRSQLAEISRAFNREFYYTPVVLVFKYRDAQKNYLAFANTERLKYKQEWREGEKAGKVSLLRDIDIQKPHAGHERIITELQIPLTGRNAVDSFAKLYNYWQEVFNVSILNKKFYKELSNWYFWAINHVKFPSEPTIEDAHRKEANLDDLIKEHNATNVIRLLTRLLFTWFIKEKKLVPDELFDLDALQKDILIEISPYHENGIFKDANKESVYYKAILQNLFFASLNCPIEADETDSRVRQFRGDESYGKHRGIDWMMRYRKYFKNPEAFLQLMNKTVPFLNGGLFECLDDKTQNLYIDGFSDQMTKGEQLVVPDYLFFGATEHVDLSPEYGVKNKGTKQAAVKGLINILHSYKFTVTENTPVEEDVALDPELLGKVFENLLASYNPETKTTARKQTGSFYTPREIVNYMVDESLIAFLKNKILQDKSEAFLEFGKSQLGLFGNETRKGQATLEEQIGGNEFDGKEEKLDKLLHDLVSFDPSNPFEDFPNASEAIVKAIDECKILDPACGSGAFPMGILQKMVHILQKLDPDNTIWKEVQKNKAKQAADTAYEIEDTGERRERLREIDEAFDQSINDPDYARKLYLIENCIYGVDIQPIATQISKLRFFISLVVDQRKNEDKPNFGIRALPNLETKFVAANTLIGIEKPKDQLNIFEGGKIKELEAQLKKIRSKLFSAKTKETKLKYREKDEALRNAIATELKSSGWPNDTAEKLAGWDPYDQNASSTFFDLEWMFDVKAFDVVIGNPPYRPIQKYDKNQKLAWSKEGYKVYSNSGNIYFLFFEKALQISKKGGVVNYITSNQWMRNKSGQPLRELFLRYNPELLIDFRGTDIFENVAVLSSIMQISKRKKSNSLRACDVSTIQNGYQGLQKIVSDHSIDLTYLDKESWLIFDRKKYGLRQEVIKRGIPIKKWGLEIYRGILTGFNEAFYLTEFEKDNLIIRDPKNKEIIKPMLRGKDLGRFYPNEIEYYLLFSRRGINIDQYPEARDYLKQYYSDLKPKKDSSEKKGRKPGNYKWYEIQDSINYYLKFYEPKMIFMNMTKDLIFSYDPEGEFLTNQKCFIVTGDHLKYLTAFFNSKFFAYFFKDNFPELLGDVREVSKVYFEQIPVFMPSIGKMALIDKIVEIIIYHKRKKLSSSISFELILDGLIANLYFPDHMKERKIDVLELVERDIERVYSKLPASGIQKPEAFDTLPDEEKEKVIERLDATWSDPENEVVKRMAQFKEKSPEILKPILES